MEGLVLLMTSLLSLYLFVVNYMKRQQLLVAVAAEEENPKKVNHYAVYINGVLKDYHSLPFCKLYFEKINKDATKIMDIDTENKIITITNRM